MKSRILLLSLLSLLLLIACRRNGPDANAIVPAVETAVVSTPSTNTPQPVTETPPAPPTAISPPPEPTAMPKTATPTPEFLTPEPTAIPTPPQVLVIPPDIETDFLLAFPAFQINDNWEVVVSSTAQEMVDDGRAAAAVLINGSGTLFAQRTQILAIPLFTAWETVSRVEAERIQAEGHPLVTLQYWADISPEQKALRIDGVGPAEPGYPLQQRLSLYSRTPVDPQLELQLQTAFTPPQTAHLAAVGDIMLDRALGNAIRAGDLDFPFSRVQQWLQAADYTIGNLESALGDRGAPVEKSYPFQAPPAAAQSLARAGFDLVSLANNHGMDFGPDALEQALSLLDAANVAVIGAGRNATAAHAPVRATINGIAFAFLGYVNVPVEVNGFDTAVWRAGVDTPGLAWGTISAITRDVQAVRDEVDHVVVLLHSGYEYVEPPSEAQLALSRAAIDAGAALVLGHHTHILQGIEFYNDGVIAYGLGNFAFEIDGPPETAVLNIWFDKTGIRELNLAPAIIQFGGQPRLATPAEATLIRQTVSDRSRYFGPTPPFP